MRTWTPAQILECVEDDDGNLIDVFEATVPSDNPYRAGLVKALWSRWRYSIIDSLDICRWIQMMQDRAELIDGTYRKLCEEWENSEDMASIKMGWRETYTDTGETAPEGTDTVVTEREDMPQTEQPDGKWLSGRDTAKSTAGIKTKTSASGEREHIDMSRLNAEEWKAVMDNLQSPYARYAEEFRPWFAEYWNLEDSFYGCRCD